MIKIRRNVFETNSSSMHSLSIIGSDRMRDVNFGEKVVIQQDEFGWGYEELTTPIEKLSYLYTEYCEDGYMLDMIKEAVKDYTGAKVEYEVIFEGYIDHESRGMIRDSITGKQSIVDLVFNDKNVIIIDNDNH